MYGIKRRKNIIQRTPRFFLGSFWHRDNLRQLSDKLNYIYIYVSKFEWFWYDFGMMVWKWYDWMIVVWWFGSCVCECCECECIQIEEIAKKCKTKNRLKEPQKISLKFFATFPPIPRHGDSLKISEESWKKSSVVIWFAFVYHCVSTEDPEEQKCYFLYYYIKEMYNIKKSSGSSGTSRTYTQLNQNTGEDFLEKVFSFYDSVFGVFRNMSSK